MGICPSHRSQTKGEEHMTRDDIIKMAKQAGLLPIDIGPTIETWQMRRKEESLVRFAELVAAAEREACAKVCDDIRYGGYVPPEDGAAATYYNDAANECAEAIRARGEQ
jgi:hypothetical protein